MWGHSRFTQTVSNIASGANYSPAVEIEGATKIFLNLATSNTATQFIICAGNTATTSQILPLYYKLETDVTVPLSVVTTASNILLDVSRAVGFKYMKVFSTLTLTDGATLSVYTAT